MEKKFKLTDETIKGDGIILHRIVALKDFNNVKKGDKGGWIEKEDNLSHEGNCWVYHDAIVYGNAKVYDNAKVFDYAKVYDNAKVFSDARIYGDAKVYDNAKIYGNAIIRDKTRVRGKAQISNNASVYGDVEIKDNVTILKLIKKKINKSMTRSNSEDKTFEERYREIDGRYEEALKVLEKAMQEYSRKMGHINSDSTDLLNDIESSDKECPTGFIKKIYKMEFQSKIAMYQANNIMSKLLELDK